MITTSNGITIIWTFYATSQVQSIFLLELEQKQRGVRWRHLSGATVNTMDAFFLVTPQSSHCPCHKRLYHFHRVYAVAASAWWSLVQFTIWSQNTKINYNKFNVSFCLRCCMASGLWPEFGRKNEKWCTVLLWKCPNLEKYQCWRMLLTHQHKTPGSNDYNRKYKKTNRCRDLCQTTRPLISNFRNFAESFFVSKAVTVRRNASLHKQSPLLSNRCPKCRK